MDGFSNASSWRSSDSISTMLSESGHGFAYGLLFGHAPQERKPRFSHTRHCLYA
jgi:hypothetical protein